jgi:cation:H+ antiporter
VTDLLLLAAGIVAVVAGAELFFDGLLGISSRLKTAPFVVTALVSGFELENLAAGIAANAKDLPGAAAGTFLGGTTFVALGVTGLAAVIRPLKADLPWKPLAAAGVSPLALAVLAWDRNLSRWDGALLIIWFIVVMVVLTQTAHDILVEGGDDGDTKSRPALRLLGGLAVLSVGGEILGEGIRNVVTRFGVSQTLLGNTAIAASVEAEELGRVAVPAKRGRSDVALGNIVGTVAHFIAFNAGVIALVKPVRLDDATLSLHLPVAALSVPLVCLLLILRSRLSRWEGAALLGTYVVYISVAVAQSL